MAGSNDGRVPARPAVDAESEQTDTSSLLAAADNLDYSLQARVQHNSTLAQPNLPIPTVPLQGHETPRLILTPLIANYHPMYTSKAVLKVNGNLNEMGANWTKEEWANKRRIVQFRKSRQGGVLSVNFKATPVQERPPNSICISSIWWEEKSDCYVTSVDIMYLLEQLIAAPNRFAVEEKNRLRRHLEGFHPVTIFKTRSDTSKFFNMVMAFGYPRPRNMKKDLKVFSWATLQPLLKAVIGKYSVMPSEPSHHNTVFASPGPTTTYNDVLRVSRNAAKPPQRKRTPNPADTQVASSKLPMASPDRGEIYLPWLEDALFDSVKDLNVDEAAREKLLEVLPDLIEAFALKIGFNVPAHTHRDTTYFVQKYNQEASKSQ